MLLPRFLLESRKRYCAKVGLCDSGIAARLSYGRFMATTHTYLDISTAHVTKEEMEAIEKIAAVPLALRHAIEPLEIPVSADTRYGAWLYVPDADPEEDAVRREAYPNIQALIDLARQNDCIYINLDADGEIEPELPRFQW